MTTHPLQDSGMKSKLIKVSFMIYYIIHSRHFKRIQETVLQRWTNDINRMDKKHLSLIVLAHASDVLEVLFACIHFLFNDELVQNAFAPLNDQVFYTFFPEFPSFF
jgi:hypothetical protein